MFNPKESAQNTYEEITDYLKNHKHLDISIELLSEATEYMAKSALHRTFPEENGVPHTSGIVKIIEDIGVECDTNKEYLKALVTLITDHNLEPYKPQEEQL